LVAARIDSYSARFGRIILLASEEILGLGELNQVLELARLADYIGQPAVSEQGREFHFKYAGRIQAALESAYGSKAGRGLALRVGRACFGFGLREFDSELRMTAMDFRMLPLPSRLKTGSEVLARLFNQFGDQRVRLELNEKNIFWFIERCPLPREREAEAVCCALAMGFFQEAYYWMSAGKYFLVEEKTCISRGDSKCTLVVDRDPVT
jgi:hypothetical protein